ncbi:MAG: pentapeptide repeat-containing protein, partial [Acidobacteriales bacterium]|nr:pentapeptide repeat-containing protein [Terriglobales bacterium]
MKAWLKRFKSSDWLTVQRVGVVLLTLAVISGVIGYILQHPEGFSLRQLITDFYTNVSTELTSIAITVLLIDTLNRRREQRVEESREREQLTRQLGSSVNEVAKRAAEELRARGWLTDGSLQECDLRIANLEEAKLWKADLQGVNLQWAKLKKANLNGSVMVGANLTQANLQAARCGGADLRGANLFEAKLYRVNFNGAYLREANLSGAHLEGARLEGADLRNAVLEGAHLDELTMLP